ncbi:hypothetical protein SISNIDRAFT_53716 [Sistotremastrum niveocremeum HHB9708]|uniref:Uncharacterized protein n=1 Tax=Sistotremastrum niveocremeum HHB9708 TaxID=1314777 RepID=A0A164V8H5_9AGAM|nr:hypothetical protein SISNIDRAFT_53716 [Sistotremastrum niveocremeum HHB9708]
MATFGLNTTSLVFLPETQSVTGKTRDLVVQIDLKNETGRRLDVGVRTTFFIFKQDISDLICSIIRAEAQLPLSHTGHGPVTLIFEAEEWRLTAVPSPWQGSQKWGFMLGDQEIRCNEYKWQFTFQAKVL